MTNQEFQAQENVTICNQKGLHARAAALFVKTANGFDAEIVVVKGDSEANGKSIMGLMMLAASKGTEIEIKANGAQANRAVGELSQLVSDKFYED